jgi:hypothetical protein
VSVSGKRLTGMINVTPITGIYGWTVRESFEKIDAITAADDGHNRKDFGVDEAQISLKLLVDITTGDYEPIVAGTEITTLKLFRHESDELPAYSFPIARVFDSTQGAEIRGRFEVSVEAENVGTYTRNEPGAEAP